MALFVGFRIQGIDADKVPAKYSPNHITPLTVYLRLEPIHKDDPESDLHGDSYTKNLNIELRDLWLNTFDQSVDTWLQEDDDIVMPDDIHPKIKYDNTRDGCLRVEGITLEDIEGIAEPLKEFINYINEEIANELDRRQEFREHVEYINSEYFGTEAN